MNGAFDTFLGLPAQDQRDVLTKAAHRLNTVPSYVEKDFWVSLVLETLFGGLPEGHPRLLFKGGTSLAKAFGLVRRFSEDIDIVVFREDLGFPREKDPTSAGGFSNKKRRAQFDRLREKCSDYVLGELRIHLTERFARILEKCRVVSDEKDKDRQTLLIEYPTLYPNHGVDDYVSPRVKLEAGAKSAWEPNKRCTVEPYIAAELPEWSFTVNNVRTTAPERTYWEKLLILHGAYHLYQKRQRAPDDKQRIARHYYDVALITETPTGRTALSNFDLLKAVREHNCIAFRQSAKKFKEACPGSVRLVPQPGLCQAVERDYQAMQGMILGDAPDFAWIMSRIQHAETIINESEPKSEGI